MENFNTPFDDVFKTLLTKCSSLIIPVINEVFGTNYDLTEKVTLLGTEYHPETEKGDLEERIADSRLQIQNKMYHIECQSRSDSTMVMRMIEYDFHIALSENMEADGEYILEFPESAVLYLRHNSRTPDSLKVTLILPDKSKATYQVPVVKVQNYDKQDIMDKNLFFFLPYYILKFEKSLDKINEDSSLLEKLKTDYQQMYTQLQQLQQTEKIDSFYLHNLIYLTQNLMNYVAKKQENIKKEVISMGGKVLELPSEKLFAKGILAGKEEGRREGRREGLCEGRREGQLEGLYIAVYKLENIGYSESAACDMIQADLQGYQAYKKENKLNLQAFSKPSPGK